MPRILAHALERLHRGERWWAAEVLLRGCGLLLLGGSWRLALAARHLVDGQGPHPSALVMGGVSTAIVVLLTCGLTLAIAGPRLLGPGRRG